MTHVAGSPILAVEVIDIKLCSSLFGFKLIDCHNFLHILLIIEIVLKCQMHPCGMDCPWGSILSPPPPSSSSLLVEGGNEGGVDDGCTPADNEQVNIQVLR